MQHSTKEKALLAFVVASLIFYVCTFLLTTNTVTNVSAVDSYRVGVYWNQTCRETEKVENITWGNLSPGSLKNVPVYIRNEDVEPMFLRKNTTKWDPLNASDFLELTWNYTMTVLAPEDVIPVKLTLSVSRYIKGISSFSFDIYIYGSDSLPGDVDGDRKVTYLDIKKVKLVIGGYIVEPRADLDGDGKVTYLDLKRVKLILSDVL